MAGKDHWVDEGYKKNSAFARGVGDVRSRNNTQTRMQAQQAATSASMPAKQTNTQMRLAALGPEYHEAQQREYLDAQQRAQQQTTQKQYLPQPGSGQFGSGHPFPNTDPNASLPPAAYGMQPVQQPYPPQPFSQQSTQPLHNAAPVDSRQYSQPNYTHPSRQFAQPNYAHPADSQQYAQPNYAQPTNSQQYAQPNYSQQMRQPDYDSELGYPMPLETPVAKTMTDEEIDERAMYDSQTRAFNFRHILRMLTHEFTRATFVGRPLSIFIVAIDNFVTVPPDAVDKAVDAFSRTLITSGRPIDMVGRYMDSRFLVVCPEMDAPQAAEVAELLRKICEATVVAHQWQNVKLTASIGVATTAPNLSDMESLIALADLGADMVAEEGGNGVFVAPADSI